LLLPLPPTSSLFPYTTLFRSCMDMSPAFIKGAHESLPSASLTFDKFHITKIMGDAVDKTRREERAEHEELKGRRYALLRNPETIDRKSTRLNSSHVSISYAVF